MTAPTPSTPSEDGDGVAPRPAVAGSTRAERAPAAVAHRNLVVVELTMVSACADAISYLGLGEVFPANMTGNTVLLGIGLATGQIAHATRSATALGAFLVGAAVVGAASPARIHRSAFLGVVAAEVALVATLCGWWLAAGGTAPTGSVRYGLIALAGSAMGAQSALVRGLGVPVSTTYITGTWTALSASLAARLRGAGDGRSDDGAHRLQGLVVATYLLTAFGAGLAYVRLGARATALPLGLLLLVLAASGAGRDAARDPTGSERRADRRARRTDG